MTAVRGVMALAMAGALAACDDGGAGFARDAQTQPILRTASAAPGPQNVPTRFARSVLQTACIDTQPDFKGAGQALARAGGFAQSAKTGTFFHQRYDMSVKIVPGRCSMVTGTSGSGANIARLAELQGVQAGPTRVFGERSYLSFFVAGT